MCNIGCCITLRVRKIIFDICIKMNYKTVLLEELIDDDDNGDVYLCKIHSNIIYSSVTGSKYYINY